MNHTLDPMGMGNYHLPAEFLPSHRSTSPHWATTFAGARPIFFKGAKVLSPMKSCFLPSVFSWFILSSLFVWGGTILLGK